MSVCVVWVILMGPTEHVLVRAMEILQQSMNQMKDHETFWTR